METTLLAGKWEMSVGNVLIPAELLGDISPNYEEGLTSAETQAGTREQPNGKASTAEITYTLYLPNIAYLRNVFDVAESDAIILGGASCSTKEAKPINIHQVCDGKDGKNDIHVYAGLHLIKFNPTLSTSDAVAIEMTIKMQPTTSGYLLLGYPDPSTPQYWDVETETWLDVA